MTNTKACINPNHDHELLHNDQPGGCNGCGCPAHYDEGTGRYYHDDGSVPPWCALLVNYHDDEGKTPCQMP